MQQMQQFFHLSHPIQGQIIIIRGNQETPMLLLLLLLLRDNYESVPDDALLLPFDEYKVTSVHLSTSHHWIFVISQLATTP